MLIKRNQRFKTFLDKWPGKKWFGIYRFMPVFFLMGACLEYTMINWDFQGKVNFYRTFKNRQIETLVEERLKLIEDSSK